ncbi:hypothetical protein ES703_125941 [subsurface metagenome]
MITEATIKQVKYPPELLPDAVFNTIPANAEVSPPVLDLRRFTPYILALVNIQLTANANVVLRARYDNGGRVRVDENTAAMLSNLVGAWWLSSKDILYYNLFGLAAVANYTTHFGVWAKGGSPVTPTIVDKLFYGIPLTNDEKAVCEKLGIRNTFEKGLLPLPISLQIEREYRIVGEETRSRSITIAVANTVYTIDTIYPKNTDEFLVLTRLAAAPGTAAQNVRLIVDRDRDAGYADLKTFALSLLAGGEVPCFIPAMTELRLTTTAAVAPGAHLFRFTYQRVRLSNILRVRFGLVSKDEVPGELWSKVLGGIL